MLTSSETDKIINRWRYLRNLDRARRAAVVGAETAAAEGDYRTQAMMLRVALRASTAIARACGVQVSGAGRTEAEERDDDAAAAAHDLIERTARSMRLDGSEDHAGEHGRRRDGPQR